MITDVKKVDEYISEFPPAIQIRFEKIRSIIQKIAPQAIESIAYGMIAYKFRKKPLVYFGGFAKHIGFYGTPTAHEKFKQELDIYKQGKGSAQFPHDKELPEKLIADMVAFKVAESNDLPS